MTALGDRMKANYEHRQRVYLTRRMPVVIRLDGRAFHSLTRKMKRPFDGKFVGVMKQAAQHVADDIQGCKVVYVQSDEVSFLLTDYDKLQTEGWFNYNLCKMVSIAASEMSVAFSRYLGVHATFDGRAFNIPREEVANYFLWRAKDWHRNSVMMYSQSFFSHKQMYGKNLNDLHEMLYGVNKNWTVDLVEHFKNGWWYDNGVWRSDILPTYSSINSIVEPCIVEKVE